MSGTYGGYAPQPERYGGGKRRLQLVHETLLHASNTEIGLDVTEGDNVWLEDYAIARGLDGAWSTNARGTNEFDPRKTQSMLPRWEAIFGAAPRSTDSLVQRRAFITFKFESFGKEPVYSTIVDDCAFLAGSAFAEVQHVDDAVGPAYYPGSPFANPYTFDGTTVDGVSPVDWWSAVLNVAVRVQRPAGLAPVAFEDAKQDVVQYLDGALPAWCTFTIYEDTHDSGGGVLVTGFYLDEANLDVQGFET